MRLCVLETDTPGEALRARHGNFADMFEAWLSPALPEARWSRVALHAGADLPCLADHDGYLITGCRHGVYDDLPWMAPLADFLRELRAARIPVGGICFGHQIMAHAFGARVEKSATGWVLGAESYDGRTALAIHQDQVLTLPDGAAEVSGSVRCPIGRIAYRFPALSVQYHPEFTAPFMADLLAAFGDERVDPALVDAAMRTLGQRLHVTEIAQDFAALFRAAERGEAHGRTGGSE